MHLSNFIAERLARGVGLFALFAFYWGEAQAVYY